MGEIQYPCAYVRSKLVASRLIAAQSPETTHGGRTASFTSMLKQMLPVVEANADPCSVSNPPDESSPMSALLISLHFT